MKLRPKTKTELKTITKMMVLKNQTLSGVMTTV